jgi:hypothetical protein
VADPWGSSPGPMARVLPSIMGDAQGYRTMLGKIVWWGKGHFGMLELCADAVRARLIGNQPVRRCHHDHHALPLDLELL